MDDAGDRVAGSATINVGAHPGASACPRLATAGCSLVTVGDRRWVSRDRWPGRGTGVRAGIRFALLVGAGRQGMPSLSQPTERVRVGFVGAGAVASRHARTLLSFPDVEIVAVAEPAEQAAARFAALTGAARYPDHEAMLAGVGLDAVYVCVPPFAHGPPELAAIRAGLPLFVEKPVAVDLPTAERVAAEIAARNLVTCVGYHWRWLDILQRARGLLEGRPVRLVLAYWLDKVPPPAWWLRRDRSGGQTVEQTTHVLDVVRALAGEVAQVHALASRTPREAYPDADVDDVAVANLRFASGALGSVASTSLLGHLHRARVDLFAEGLALELSETELVVADADGRRVEAAAGSARGLPDRDFIDAVAGRPVQIRAPYAEALQTHRLACALTASALHGTPVDLPTRPVEVGAHG